MRFLNGFIHQSFGVAMRKIIEFFKRPDIVQAADLMYIAFLLGVIVATIFFTFENK